METSVKRCRKCILPANAPNIRFDRHGICNYCDTYRRIEYQGEDALLELIDHHRGSSRCYDCIVNISGGRDSSYAILKISKNYGMKVLAVNYKNPYTHPLAAENIARIRDVLKVDLVQFQLRGNLHRTLLQSNLRAWYANPSAAMVPMVCLGCKLIWAEIMRLARQHGISMIISGGNLLEQVGFWRELLGVSRDARIHQFYSLYAVGLLREAARNFKYLNRKTLIHTIRGYCYANPNAPFVRLSGRGLARVDLFHFVPWDETEVVSRIEEELEWRSPPPPSGTWRFDCKIGQLKEYMYSLTLGMSEKEGFYSRMIREGLISREVALRRVARESRLDWEVVDDLLCQIGIDREQFEKHVIGRIQHRGTMHLQPAPSWVHPSQLEERSADFGEPIPHEPRRDSVHGISE